MKQRLWPRRAILIAALGLLVAASSSTDALRQRLGPLARELADAPLLIAMPSLARAGEQLAPTLGRLGLSLPDLDPTQLFIEWRVRLMLDPLRPRLLTQAGIDPSGPAYILDDGSLTRPVWLFRLLDPSTTLLEQGPLARVAQREALIFRHKKNRAGVVAQGLAIAADADPRVAWARDGRWLAFAPRGCARDLGPLLRALRPRRRLLAGAGLRDLITALPAAELLLVARSQALEIGPTSTGRRLAPYVDRLAVALGGDRQQARLSGLIQPSARGLSWARARPSLGGQTLTAARRLGAASIWMGAGGRAPLALERTRGYDLLSQVWRELPGPSPWREVKGGLGLHLMDLEPMLPGLAQRRRVEWADRPYFAEQAWTISLVSAQRARALVARMDAQLGTQGGQFSGADDDEAWRQYARNGRVLGYRARGAWLDLCSGPGCGARVDAVLQGDGRSDTSPPPASAMGDLLALVLADGAELRGLLGRVGLLSSGDNNDLRAIWAARQVAASSLAKLGELRLGLWRQKKHLRVEGRLQLGGDLRGGRKSHIDTRDLRRGGQELDKARGVLDKIKRAGARSH